MIGTGSFKTDPGLPPSAKSHNDMSFHFLKVLAADRQTRQLCFAPGDGILHEDSAHGSVKKLHIKVLHQREALSSFNLAAKLSSGPCFA